MKLEQKVKATRNTNSLIQHFVSEHSSLINK